jgi:hypothetical protein
MSKDNVLGTHKTAMQLHRETAWNNQPCLCGSRDTVLRVKMLASYDEVLRRQPDFLGKLAADNPDGTVPVISTAYGPMVCVSTVTACSQCKQTILVEAAKHPSWVLPEMDEGPEPDRIQAQVPR